MFNLYFFRNKLTAILLALAVTLMTSACSLLPTEKAAPTESEKVLEQIKNEREFLLKEGDRLYSEAQFDSALNFYFKIVRDPHDENDIVYDKALLGLARLYEKSDQSEKAILAYDELLKRNTPVLNKITLRLALMKNHFRVTNYYQARQVKQEIDREYKSQNISLQELYQTLYYHSYLQYDRHILDEAIFIGELQKYFVYVIESDLYEESEKLTDLLILYYENFLAQFDNSILSAEIKKKLAVLLLDQLGRFERYKMPQQDEQTQLSRFSKFAETNKLKLTERLANGKF